MMRSRTVWIFQTGEPLHVDGIDARPMRAINLSNALVDAGHKVVLWSSAFYHQEKRHRSFSQQSIKVSDSLEVRLIPSRGYQRNIGVERLIDHAQLSINLYKVLQQCKDIPDVAFIGYPPIETAAVLTRWCAKRGIPTLLDVKDQWPSLFLKIVPPSFRSLTRKILWPYFHLALRAMQDATALCAMANSFLQWSLEFSGRQQTDKDGVFPLTSPLGQVQTKHLDEARKWWTDQGILDDGRPRVCFVGSHSQSFDFKPLAEAARMASRESNACQFVICGDGECSAEMRAMFSNLPNVYFPGWIDRPKIEALAERCMASIAPYLNTEDFRMSIPNKIIDALSLGLPILSPLQGEVKSLIDDHDVGLSYDADKGKSLYGGIQTLINDPILQQSMSQKALALHAQRFSFEIVYGGLVKHLEKLANKSSAHNYLFYKATSKIWKLPNTSIAPEYHVDIWKPKILSIAPKGLLTKTFAAWWLFHWLRVFKNRKYRIYLVYTKDGKQVHYTVILPAHFRFPFMQDNDLQIGPLGTNECYRRQGLAQYCINTILREYVNTDVRLWYVVREENEASIKLINNNHFQKVGEGRKLIKNHTRLFSYFYISKYL